MTQNEDDATIALELKEKFSDINNSDTKESQYDYIFFYWKLFSHVS